MRTFKNPLRVFAALALSSFTPSYMNIKFKVTQKKQF